MEENTIFNKELSEPQAPHTGAEGYFNTNPYEATDIENKIQVNKKNKENDYGTVDAFIDGWKANAMGIGRFNHPSGSRLDPDFKLSNPENKAILDTLEPDVAKAVIDYNPNNEEDFYAVIARTTDEVEWQKNIYEWGGVPGSITANLVGGIIQPDMALGGALLAPVRAPLKAAKAAQTSVKLSNMIRKTNKKPILNISNTTANNLKSTATTGAEFAAIGTGLEILRQQTSGVSFEDDIYNVAIFGMVLGSGGKATSNLLAGGDRNRIAKAMDKDIKETKDFIRPGSAGPMLANSNVKWSTAEVSTENVKFLPTTGWAGQLNKASVRGRLYNVQSPKLRNLISWMMPSKLPLKNTDGTFHTQGIKSAEDLLDTEYKGLFNDLRSANRLIYSEYRKNTDNPLNEYDFGKELYKQRIESNKVIRKHEAKIKYYEEAIQDIKARLEKTEGEELTSLQKQELEFTTQLEILKENKPISKDLLYGYFDKANKALTDYYKKMSSRAQTIIKGKEDKDIDLDPSDYYTTRLWNKEAISNYGASKVVSMITKAIQESPTASALKEIDAVKYKEYFDNAEKIADNMVQKISTSASLNDLMDYLPKGKGSGALESRFNIARRIDVDENMLGDLLRSNIDDLTELYHRDLAGKLALKSTTDFTSKADFKETIDDIIKELRDLDYTPKEIRKITDDLEVAIDSLLGTRSIANNPDSTGQKIKRYVTKWNNITLGAGFGYTSLLEIGPVVALTGVKGLKYMLPAFKNTLNKYRGKESDRAIFNQLKAMGIGMDVFNSRTASRFSDDGINFTNSKAELILDKGETAVMHGSGLIGVVDAYKDIAGVGYIHKLHELGIRLNKGESWDNIVSTADKSRYARHGLTKEDIIQIGKEPVIYKDGYLEDLNFEKWDSNLMDKLADATNRAVKGNVLEPSSLDLPSAMTDPNGIFAPLMLQYMRFPIAATESYLLRGLAEKDKAAVMGAIISTTVLGSLEVMRDTLLVESGAIEQSSFDLDTEEGQKKLAWKLFNYNPYSGIVPTLANVGFGIAGEPQPGTTYTPKDVLGTFAGPAYSRATGYIDIIQNQIQEPGSLTKTEMYQMKINTPYLGSLPIIKDIWSDYIKTNY